MSDGLDGCGDCLMCQMDGCGDSLMCQICEQNACHYGTRV